jgi:hypothetical protein
MKSVIKSLNEKINKLYAWHRIEMDSLHLQQNQIIQLKQNQMSITALNDEINATAATFLPKPFRQWLVQLDDERTATRQSLGHLLFLATPEQFSEQSLARVEAIIRRCGIMDPLLRPVDVDRCLGDVPASIVALSSSISLAVASMKSHLLTLLQLFHQAQHEWDVISRLKAISMSDMVGDEFSVLSQAELMAKSIATDMVRRVMSSMTPAESSHFLAPDVSSQQIISSPIKSTSRQPTASGLSVVVSDANSKVNTPKPGSIVTPSTAANSGVVSPEDEAQLLR